MNIKNTLQVDDYKPFHGIQILEDVGQTAQGRNLCGYENNINVFNVHKVPEMFMGDFILCCKNNTYPLVTGICWDTTRI